MSNIDPFVISYNVFMNSYRGRWDALNQSLIDYGISIRAAHGLPQWDYIDYDIVIDAIHKINPDTLSVEFPKPVTKAARYRPISALLKLSVWDPSAGALSQTMDFHGPPGNGDALDVRTTSYASTDVLDEPAEDNIRRFADWEKEIPGNPDNPNFGPMSIVHGPFGLNFGNWGITKEKGSRSQRCSEWAGAIFEGRISAMERLSDVFKTMMDAQLKRDLVTKNVSKASGVTFNRAPATKQQAKDLQNLEVRKVGDAFQKELRDAASEGSSGGLSTGVVLFSLAAVGVAGYLIWSASQNKTGRSA